MRVDASKELADHHAAQRGLRAHEFSERLGQLRFVVGSPQQSGSKSRQKPDLPRRSRGHHMRKPDLPPRTAPIERGRCDPRLSTMLRLAGAFGVRASRLVDRAG